MRRTLIWFGIVIGIGVIVILIWPEVWEGVVLVWAMGVIGYLRTRRLIDKSQAFTEEMKEKKNGR